LIIIIVGITVRFSARALPPTSLLQYSACKATPLLRHCYLAVCGIWFASCHSNFMGR